MTGAPFTVAIRVVSEENYKLAEYLVNAYRAGDLVKKDAPPLSPPVHMDEMQFRMRCGLAKREIYGSGQGKVYAVTPWPKRIEVARGFNCPALYWSKGETSLDIRCENGTASYLENGSDATTWRGVLHIARGDHPLAAL